MACWGETRWGVRRLLNHIKQLPRDSAYVRSLSGELADWSEQVEFQAQTVDAIERLIYYLLRVNGTDDATIPTPVPRPGRAPVIETVGLGQFGAIVKGPK